MQHVTVLKQKAIEMLNLSSGSVVVDCTLGSGGHAKEILSQLSAEGTYIGIDADPTAIAAISEELSSYEATVHLVNDNFRNLKKVLETLSISSVDAVLADLGWRMEQFDGSAGLPRGFSFNVEEPLEMTFGNPSDYPFTAADIVNDWEEEDIANVIYGYGQDRFARRIARAIVKERAVEPIKTSTQLGEIVRAAAPAAVRRGRTHPATKTFQALRIAVNDEFDTLNDLLLDGFTSLNSGGRMVIISFHSLEDRMVKETFKTYTRDQIGTLVHKKPLVPEQEELQANPRSRSAKLRTIEKV